MRFTTKFRPSVYYPPLLLVLIFCGELVILVGRGRSFWLDECLILDNLTNFSSFALLSGKELLWSQQFPRFYLFCLDILGSLTDNSPFWMRMPSLLFGAGAVYVWAMIFRRFFPQTPLGHWWRTLALGLFLSNGMLLYYCFELKPYSADIFFAGAILWISWLTADTPTISLWPLCIVIIVGCLFSYGAIFIATSASSALLLHPPFRKQLKNEMTLKNAIGLTIPLAITIALIWFWDIRLSGSRGTLQGYWGQTLAEGTTFFERISSSYVLLKRALISWWWTDIGALSARLVPTRSWILNFEGPWGSPDIRNIFLFLSFGGLIRSIIRQDSNAFLSKVVLLTCLLVMGLAAMQLYPLGAIRVALYMLPFSILFLMSSTKLYGQWNRGLILQNALVCLFSAGFIWLVIRYSIVLWMVLASRNLPENIQEALRVGRVTPTDIVYYPPSSELNIRSQIKSLPQTIYQQWKPNSLNEAISHNIVYGLWVHKRTREFELIVNALSKTHTPTTIYSPPHDNRIELIRFTKSKEKQLQPLLGPPSDKYR